MIPPHVVELVRKYDRPGPRYTSYPTAVVFDEQVDAQTYDHHLARAAERSDDPLSLYIHLPFCRTRCWYCGCNVVITSKGEVERRYRDTVLREVAEVARRLGSRRRLSQLHWGGGTPTYADPEDLGSFHRSVLEHFELAPEAEVAIEVDPRVTTPEHLAVLAGVGFNRLSAGVQDLDPTVQSAIGRNQTHEETRTLIEEARRVGFVSINVDLIYGLPHQTPDRLARTLEQVTTMRPPRVAIYGYAHLPSLQRHQGRVDEEALPEPQERLELFAQATAAFVAAGYEPIGMDHFALPEDELAQAARTGHLARNFMGYTVRAAPDMIGCGLSAIGDVGGAYVQNQKKLIDYQRAIADGQLATQRGVVLSEEDHVRRHVINELMVNLRLRIPETESMFGIDFAAAFAPELEALQPLVDDELVALTPERIQVSDLGRRFLRNICMPFDAYIGSNRAGRFSRTI